MASSEDGDLPVPAEAYAAGLREVVSRFTAQGGTQKAIATATNLAPSTLSRYLSGGRVAPRTFLSDLRSFLDEQGQPMDAGTIQRLDGLCTRAHLASGASSVQLAELKEEIARLREEQGHARQVAERRLTDLEGQANRLARALQEALDRVAVQDESLRYAQDYAHQIEAELAEQYEQSRRLQQEVVVLREQNRRLVQEQTRAVPGVSTQAPALETAATSPAGQSVGGASDSAHDPAGMPEDTYGPSPKSRDPYGAPAPGSRFQKHHTAEAGTDYVLVVGVSLVTYAAFILQMAFVAGLEADPGPAIWKMVLAGTIVVLWPFLSVRTLQLASPADDPRSETFEIYTLRGQFLVLVLWFAYRFAMDPFNLPTMNTGGQWLAEVAGLL
ncbi:hypothetical protein [Streptomyces sp. NPDC059651]|uniref:hypothetical protein n=1 Tax=Streptomyces sp. NPDC059651 TaxID=3346897 RepID=UPI0036A03F24